MSQTKPQNNLTDEILAEVIEHKRAIAKEFDYDVRSLVRSLQEQEENHPNVIYPNPSENKLQPSEKLSHDQSTSHT